MNKSGKKWISVVLALTLAFLFLLTGMMSGQTAQAANAGYNTEVDKGIAVVVVHAKGTMSKVDDDFNTVDQWKYDDWYSQGTGFFVGEEGKDPQYLLTNYHVVQWFLTRGKGEEWAGILEEQGTIREKGKKLRLYFEGKFSVRVYYSEGDFSEAAVIDYLEDTGNADCAILKLDVPTNKRKPLALMIPTEEMRGAMVYAVGFPGIAENVLTDASKWSMEDASVTGGTINKLVTMSGSRVHRIQMDAGINSGSSGGPLVTAGEGYVIGMNTNGWTEDDMTLYYAVNIDHAVELLKKNNVPFDLIDSNDNGIVRVIIIVAAVVVLAVGVVVAVVLVKKNKKGGAGKTQKNVGNDSGYRIKGLQGVFAGKVFAVNGTVRIGRDPSKNELVFPAEASGVSRVHCAILLQGGQIYIKDLGSTHGTFLGNGQRLVASQPVALKPGDRFYLGSEKQSFVITAKEGK